MDENVGAVVPIHDIWTSVHKLGAFIIENLARRNCLHTHGTQQHPSFGTTPHGEKGIGEEGIVAF